MIWGPIDHTWPYWFAIRLAYLIAIPAAAVFLLEWMWRRWQPDEATEKRLTGVIADAVAGALFVGAALELQANHHFECDHEVQTRDGTECVGDTHVSVVTRSVPSALPWLYTTGSGA